MVTGRCPICVWSPPPTMCAHRSSGSRHLGRGRSCGPVASWLSRTSLCPWPRVYLLYHTWSQVLYGALAGSLMAVAWFVFTQEVLTPLFPRIAAW